MMFRFPSGSRVIPEAGGRPSHSRAFYGTLVKPSLGTVCSDLSLVTMAGHMTCHEIYRRDLGLSSAGASFSLGCGRVPG